MDPLLKIASELLLVDVNKRKWDVFHQKDDLFLIHPKNRESMWEFENLRSVVIDKEQKTIVAPPYKVVYDVIIDSLPQNFINGKMKTLILKDSNDNKHSIERDEVSFLNNYDGVTLRVFRHKGQTYVSQAKNLNGMKGSWGLGKTFDQLWEECSAPNLSEFYNEKPYSPWIYEILLVHPTLLFGTKSIPNEKPFFILTDKYRSYTESTCPYPKEDVEFDCQLNYTIGNGFIKPEDINYVLKYGYENVQKTDFRLNFGEAIILKTSDKVFRICSPSYVWRREMKDHKQDLKQQFYGMLTNVYKAFRENNNKLFKDCEKKFVFFSPIKIDIVKSRLMSREKILSFALATPQEIVKITSSLKSYTYNVWLNLIFSLPFSQQIHAINLFSKMRKDRDLLAKILFDIYTNKAQSVSNRTSEIVDHIRKKMKLANCNYSEDENLRYFIQDVVNKESPYSMYIQVREFSEKQDGLPTDVRKIKNVFFE